jgi:hypothetical protein
LAVPALIEGDDLANGADVDGLSLILYLSYLKQADAGKAQAKEAAVEAEKKQPKDDGKQGEGRNATDAEVEAKPEVEKSESDAKEQPRKNEAEKSVAETKVETRANEVAVAERKEEQKAATAAHAAAHSAESEPATKRPPASAAAPSADSPVAAAVAVSEKSEDRGFQAQAPAKDAVSPAAVAPHGADDTAKEAAVTAVTTQAKNEGGEAAGPEEESKKKKKEKKEKPGKKKTKKSKDPANGEENGDGGDKKSKKKLKKLKKKTSSLAPKQTDEAVEQTTSPAPEATVASASAKKVIAPLPHSRLPARTGEDLSYLVGVRPTRPTFFRLLLRVFDFHLLIVICAGFGAGQEASQPPAGRHPRAKEARAAGRRLPRCRPRERLLVLVSNCGLHSIYRSLVFQNRVSTSSALRVMMARL